MPTGPFFDSFCESAKAIKAATSSITGGIVILVRTARMRACSALPFSRTSGPYFVSFPAR